MEPAAGAAWLRHVCLRQGMADRSSDDRLAALQAVAVLILDDLGVDRKAWSMDNGQLSMKRTPLCRGYFCMLHAPCSIVHAFLPRVLAVSDIRRQQEWSIDNR
jgi:hypothetical protein